MTKTLLEKIKDRNEHKRALKIAQAVKDRYGEPEEQESLAEAEQRMLNDERCWESLDKAAECSDGRWL